MRGSHTLYRKDVDRAVAGNWRVWRKWSGRDRSRLMGTVIGAGVDIRLKPRLVEVRWDDGTVTEMDYWKHMHDDLPGMDKATKAMRR